MHSLNGICGIRGGKNFADFDVSEISRYQEVDLQLLACPVLPTGCCFQENLTIISAFSFFAPENHSKSEIYSKAIVTFWLWLLF